MPIKLSRRAVLTGAGAAGTLGATGTYFGITGAMYSIATISGTKITT
jgi:hypothetical protein